MKKRPWLLALIALNLVVLVALAFVYPHLMVSPGALVAGHREMATDCFACHSPWRGAGASACVECHKVADIGLRTSRGQALPKRADATPAFHQELKEQDCLACHTDHQGAEPGPLSRRAFSHALLKTAVQERCQACHRTPTDALHRKISGQCQACHRTEAWKPASFEHEKYFVLDRDHDTECATCHTGSDFKRYTCYGCHEHTLAKVRRDHQEEGIRDFENCVECHRSAQDEPEHGKGRGRERD